MLVIPIVVGGALVFVDVKQGHAAKEAVVQRATARSPVVSKSVAIRVAATPTQTLKWVKKWERCLMYGP